MPASELWTDRFANWAVKARLVTQYPHAGIVIGDTLYHSTGSEGVHAEPGADLSGYVLIDLGESFDVDALARYELVAGAGYDFFSLLAFVITSARDSKRWYCYELAYYLMTGLNPHERVTPEMLILTALRLGGVLITALPPVRAGLIH